MSDDSEEVETIERVKEQDEIYYGNHRIEITVLVVEKSTSPFNLDNPKPFWTGLFYDVSHLLSRNEVDGLFREIVVEAHQAETDDLEAENKTSSLLSPLGGTYEPSPRYAIASFLGDKTREELMREDISPPPIEVEVEEAVRPVLDRLDTLYYHTEAEYQFDLDISVEFLECETSWVNVKDAEDVVAEASVAD